MPRTEALLLHLGDSLVRIDPVTDARAVLARKLPERSRITMAPTEDYLILSRTKTGLKEDPDIVRIVEPDDRQPGWRDRTYLVKWDLATGDTLVLAKGRYSSHLDDISADGRKLLISSPRSRLETRPTTVEAVLVMDALHQRSRGDRQGAGAGCDAHLLRRRDPPRRASCRPRGGNGRFLHRPGPQG